MEYARIGTRRRAAGADHDQSQRRQLHRRRQQLVEFELELVVQLELHFPFEFQLELILELELEFFVQPVFETGRPTAPRTVLVQQLQELGRPAPGAECKQEERGPNGPVSHRTRRMISPDITGPHAPNLAVPPPPRPACGGGWCRAPWPRACGFRPHPRHRSCGPSRRIGNTWTSGVPISITRRSSGAVAKNGKWISAL